MLSTKTPKFQTPPKIDDSENPLLRILKFTGSNHGPETGYPGWDFPLFSSVTLRKCRNNTSNWVTTFPSSSLRIHYSVTTYHSTLQSSRQHGSLQNINKNVHSFHHDAACQSKLLRGKVTTRALFWPGQCTHFTHTVGPVAHSCRYSHTCFRSLSCSGSPLEQKEEYSSP
jgi:hypothetical protein